MAPLADLVAVVGRGRPRAPSAVALMFGRPLPDLLAYLGRLETTEARHAAAWLESGQLELARDAARRSRKATRAAAAVGRRVHRRIMLVGQLPTTVEPY